MRALAATLALLLIPCASVAESVPSEDQLRQLWQRRLDGLHFTARVLLTVTRGAKREQREIRVWRDDAPDSNQERLLARFVAPPDLRDLALLYIEQHDRPNDYFVYQPELKRVRRLAGRLARADVYGVDLEYLGFGVAQIEPTDTESIEAADLDGRPTVRVVERARRFNQRFDERRVWLDRGTWIPLRTQHVRNGQVTLDARTHAIEVVHGIPTPMRVSFDRAFDGERVDLHVAEVDYRSPIPRAHFSTLALIPR